MINQLSARSRIASRTDDLIDPKVLHQKNPKLTTSQAPKCSLDHLKDIQRRDLLQSIAILGVATSWLTSPRPSLASPAAEPSTSQIIQVGQDVRTIAEALKLSQDGDTIVLSAGKYHERVILDKAVSLVAAPGAIVEISWQTEEHYESTILCTVDGATIKNITIRHSSPSIANNYAVQFTQSNNAILEDCDISSTTGSAVGVEGGSPRIINCSLHDCERSGIMVFSDLEGNPGTPKVQNCKISNNKLNGVLVRDGAEPAVVDNRIENNGGYGLVLQGCGGMYTGNVLEGNRKGQAAVNLLLDGLTVEDLAKENGLQPSQIVEKKV